MKIKNLRQMTAMMIVLIFTGSMIVHALPTDWKVESGSAEFQVEENNMTVTSADNSTVINFKTFDVAEHETVNFRLPSIESRVLGRVTNGMSSNIYGGVNCNGSLYLVNEAGFVIGERANINATNLVISTRDISTTDFLNGDYVFNKLSNDQLHGLLLNKGKITLSRGGFGVMIAETIDNKGVIVAPAGRIILAGGNAVRLDLSNDGKISVAIDEKAASSIMGADGNPITDQISNTGKLEAEGGEVILKAESLPAVFEKAIRLDGEIRATRIVNEGGLVSIVADGDVELSAVIDAHTIQAESWGCLTVSKDLNSSGGSITLLADSDMNGAGSLTQNAELIQATGEGNVLLDGSGVMLIKTVSTDTGFIKIGTRVRPDAITGSPRYVHENGDMLITNVVKEERTTKIVTQRGDELMYATGGDVSLECKAGKIADVSGNTMPGLRVELSAGEFNIASTAFTTVLINRTGDMEVSKVIELADDFVEISGKGVGRVQYLITNNITPEAQRGAVDTAPGVSIPGNIVRLNAQRIGTIANPAGVNADLTYINILQKDIEIAEMWGLGSSICIRGPAPQPEIHIENVNFKLAELYAFNEKPALSVSDNAGFLLFIRGF